MPAESQDFFSRVRALVPNAMLPRSWRSDIPVVPVVRLSGTIASAMPLMQPLNLSGVARTLEKAFSVKSAPAVALVINSPGGSAAQSHLIYKRIRALAEEKDKHVFAFVEDAAASGGYMIACAADEIIADPASIVGSIGVISATFGFDKLIEKIGVERRVYTAGASKSILDPFKPEREEDVARIQAIQTEVHALFVDLVKKRRGALLHGSDGELFSGAFWVGNQALERGLIDGVGDLRGTLRVRYGEDVRMTFVNPPTGFLMRRQPGISAEGMGAGAVRELAGLVEERAMWARLGL